MFELFERMRGESKIIGFTSGVFDLLHAGHIMMLEESKSHCDYLIVGLLVDPTRDRPTTKNSPIQTMWERFVQLQAVRSVDIVVPFSSEADLEHMLRMIEPNLRFVGEEYRDTRHTGFSIPGIKIIYNRRRHPYSSTELRNRL